MKQHLHSHIITFAMLILFPLLSIGKGTGGGGSGGGMGRGMGTGNNPHAFTSNHLEEIPEPGKGMKQGQLANLRSFLNLDDTQLQAMIDTLEKIKSMSAEEKAALREKISKFENLPPESQQFIRQGWGQASKEDRMSWQQMMSSMSQEEHIAIQNQLQSIPFEERNAFRLQKIKEWKESHPKGEVTGDQ